MSDGRAALVAVLLVVLASAIGISLGSRRAPPPSPMAAPTIAATASPSASPVDIQVRAFAQPLSSGCATANAVWIVADGGAAIRFDGREWSIPDPALRSLSALACRASTVLAVGANGGVVTIDDELRTVRVDRIGVEDLHAVALVPGGAVVAGANGTVLQQGPLDWASIAPDGLSDDLHGVAFAAPELWVVGAHGATLRNAGRGWDRFGTPSGSDLRAVASDAGRVFAVGDKGTVLRFTPTSGWLALPTDTDADLRAVAIVGATSAWAVGDLGTAIEISGERSQRVDLGTACTLRAVFAQGSAVWIVGSDGVKGGAWRVTASGTDRWGTC